MITWRFKHWWSRRGLGRMMGQIDAMSDARTRGLTRLLAQLNDAQGRGDGDAVVRAARNLDYFRKATEAAAGVVARIPAGMPELPPPEEAGAPHEAGLPTPSDEHVYRYSVSSATLAEAYAYLTQRSPGTGRGPEFMLAVTGTRAAGIRTLERLIEVKLDRQSFGQAAFDMQDFTRVAVSLYEHGQALHGVFHSHRFGGPPQPSGTDMRLQTILEDGGYPAIQAVFSEDGYVRFFARERPFVVEIYGKGVIPVDGKPNLYRIVQLSTLPYPRPAAASSGRSVGIRSLPARARR